MVFIPELSYLKKCQSHLKNDCFALTAKKLLKGISSGYFTPKRQKTCSAVYGVIIQAG